MMILSLDITVNFKNSADCGRITHAVSPEKQEKITINLMCSYTFEKIFVNFYRGFITDLTLHSSLYIKPLNTISIATSQAAQSN